MTVNRKVGISVIDHDHLTVPLEPVAEDDAPFEDGAHGLARGCGDIDAGMRHLGAETRVTHVAERDREPTPGGPLQLTALARETQGRHLVGGTRALQAVEEGAHIALALYPAAICAGEDAALTTRR